jgi:late competence protein required for DNA uptake (superfamily II DNA/RNA helicase)
VGATGLLILIAGLIVIAYGLYVPRTLANAERSSDDPHRAELLKRFRESPTRRIITGVIILIGIGLTAWGVMLVVS